MTRTPPTERRKQILEVLRQTSLEDALARTDFRELLRQEAELSKPGDTQALVTPDVYQDYIQHAPVWRQRKAAALLATRGARAIIVPGFLGSALRDTSGTFGLIWIDPLLLANGAEINALKLAALDGAAVEADADGRVRVEASDCVPLAYDLLGWFLWMNGYSVSYAPFDWRKELDGSARNLERMIRDHFAETAAPVRLIAHSQGSLVARRALQLLGVTDALQMVQMLVLLGPATFGTFSAAMALSGNHEQIEQFQRYAIHTPEHVELVFQSMSGLYQLLPWNKDRIPWVPALKEASFWKSGIDKSRLERFYGWAEQIDARFFNDRTRIILGDAETIDSVHFEGNRLVKQTTTSEGDGTVPDSLAKIDGVLTFKAPNATHALLAANSVVCRAVVNLLAGITPRVVQQLGAAQDVWELRDDRAQPTAGHKPARRTKRDPAEDKAADHSPVRFSRLPPEPTTRRVRVFALDPLLASSLDTAQFAELVLELKWNDVGQQPAPIGEYLEVVDVDPQSGRYYPPVDLNHPYVLAQDGLKPSESNPQFHQQMTFAVSMATIHAFEQSLGRVAVWSPHLVRDERSKVGEASPDSQYVPRLRLYPHAMRQRNAYYDPERKAILFGYFPAEGATGGLVAPGGTIFTCVSFDIIAHETTHALLDGQHRYLIYPSNPDVLAFHEGFADIVALLQRFSHTDFLKAQITRADGDLTRENLLGQLAGQFAEGTGSSGKGLRDYLGSTKDGKWLPASPDPTKIQSVIEPHARGALLVAAVFEVLVQIYRRRSADLVRLAQHDASAPLSLSGNPELVERLADEAATAARHLLRMCIRALDYLPPVDVTFGEYLRALLTADYDLVRNDDRRYRVAVVDGFRKWGIYPADAHTLLESDLFWRAPDNTPIPNLIKWIEQERRAQRFSDWMIGADRRRAFRSRYELGASLHQWLLNGHIPLDSGRSLGMCLDKNAPLGSIERNDKDPEKRPKFEIHAVHPCLRVGPDGQQLQDIVIEIVQRRKIVADPAEQKKLDEGKLAYDAAQADFYFRGGCTLVVDGRSGDIRYAIRKGIANEERLEAERNYRGNQNGLQLAATYFPTEERNPFRFLHNDAR